eukprot:3742087-Pleurochrysis_carterae.AAC.1
MQHVLTTGRRAHALRTGQQLRGAAAAARRRRFAMHPRYGDASLFVQFTPRNTVPPFLLVYTSRVAPSRVAPSRLAAVRQCTCASADKLWLRCVGRGLLHTHCKRVCRIKCRRYVNMQHANAQAHQSAETITHDGTYY